MLVWVLLAVWYIAIGLLSCVFCKPDNALQLVILVALWPFLYVASVVYVLVDGLTRWR